MVNELNDGDAYKYTGSRWYFVEDAVRSCSLLVSSINTCQRHENACMFTWFSACHHGRLHLDHIWTEQLKFHHGTKAAWKLVKPSSKCSFIRQRKVAPTAVFMWSHGTLLNSVLVRVVMDRGCHSRLCKSVTGTTFGLIIDAGWLYIKETEACATKDVLLELSALNMKV